MKCLTIVAAVFMAAVPVAAQVENTVSAGIAIPIGDGSDGMRLGPTFCLEPIGRFNEYVGVGGHLDYTWMTMKPLSFWGHEITGGIHLFDVAFVPKFYLPITEVSHFALEVDPGFTLGINYAHYGTTSDSEIEPYFGLTIGGVFCFKAFSLGMKYRRAQGNGGDLNWLALQIGYRSGY
jgi:hypothetical protein